MSRLDFLTQTTPRLVDTHSRSAAVTPDAQESSGNTGGRDFSSLLEGFSEGSQKEGTAILLQEGDLLNAAVDRARSELDDTDTDPLQALLPDVPSGEENGATALQTASPVYSILENLLPRILSQGGNGRTADSGQQNASLASSDLLLPLQDGDEASLLKPGLGSRLSVTVQNQETHFRPVVEGLNVESAEAGHVPAGAAVKLPSEDMLAGNSTESGVKSLQTARHAAAGQTLNEIAAEVVTTKRVEEQSTVNKASFERVFERSETQKQSSIAGPKVEGGALPPGTLQHIAGAILDDVKGLPGTQYPGLPGGSLTHVATAKASGGVLRVLNLQLKPAELGLVTIKMRLSGDNLEMEIQAESEETAELLRNDAEKLSNLLRVSGYRPDVINIQPSEAVSHDRSLLNRPQQGTQGQGQSFQQGAAGGQGESSHHRGGQYEGSGSEIHRDSKEDPVGGGGRSGGIYL